MNDHIRPRRKFANCHPLDSTVLIVAEYDGGNRVTVTDTRGKNRRSILASSLRASAVNARTGKPYKSGYAPVD